MRAASMCDVAEAAILTAVRLGETAAVRMGLRQLPTSWLQEHGTGLVSLASGHGHYELMTVLRSELRELLASDEAVAALTRELEANVAAARQRASAAAAAATELSRTEAAALHARTAIDPLRRMTRGESDRESICSGRSSRRSSRSSCSSRSSRSASARRCVACGHKRCRCVEDPSGEEREEVFTKDDLVSELEDALDLDVRDLDLGDLGEEKRRESPEHSPRPLDLSIMSIKQALERTRKAHAHASPGFRPPCIPMLTPLFTPSPMPLSASLFYFTHTARLTPATMPRLTPAG